MSNQQKRISNPLTVISVFAGLAEVMGTVAIKLVIPDLQHIFIWFVMLFPLLLVTAFFVTLNFNPKVLYAPSDFQSDESFKAVIFGQDRVMRTIDSVSQELQETEQRILEQTLAKLNSITEQERQSISDHISSELQKIQSRLDNTKIAAAEISIPVIQMASRRGGPYKGHSAFSPDPDEKQK